MSIRVCLSIRRNIATEDTEDTEDTEEEFNRIKQDMQDKCTKIVIDTF